MTKVDTKEYLVTVTPLPGHFPKRKGSRGLRTLTERGSNGTLTQEEETKNKFIRCFKEGRQIAKSAGNNTRFIRAIIPGNNPFGIPEYEFQAGTGERVIALNVCELREKLALLAWGRLLENAYKSLEQKV